jgi:hypothetical protein
LAIVGRASRAYSWTALSGPVARRRPRDLLGTDGSGVDVLSEMMYGRSDLAHRRLRRRPGRDDRRRRHRLTAGYTGGGTDVGLMR